MSARTERVLLFLARDANSRIVNITHGLMEPERGDSKSERLRKKKAVTPHSPAGSYSKNGTKVHGTVRDWAWFPTRGRGFVRDCAWIVICAQWSGHT